ncbi:MAG: Gfo/Idh/MocA family oxidoreductase [Coleofasciculus sp. S288]|nr:Gfo/Idh/MocA family oxidoreductase [Coleofasciculus sp. S288]
MKRTGIVILGAGRWGVHLVRNFLEHPDAEVVAVVDPHVERLAALKERFDLNGSVILAANWDSVRNSPEVEAVAIATPATTHYALIEDALRQGYHVLAEKPLTLNVSECLELCRLAEQQQRQLMVDHTYLFHPAVQRGQEVVQSGRLGELRYGYAARTHLGPVRQDVDALWDLAIHDIAIFNAWLGEQPIEVQATGRVWLTRERDQLGVRPDELNKERTHNSRQQGLADLVQVTLTYPSGFQALIHLCWLNPDKQRRLGIVGTQGTLIFDELLAEAPLTLQLGYLEQNGDYFTPTGQHREVVEIEPGEPLRLVCDRFLTRVRNSQPSPISSGWVGAKLVQILCCLSQSLQQGGRPVTVPQSLS